MKKKFYQSKKAMAMAVGSTLIVLAYQYLPESRPVLDKIVATLIAYIGGQTIVDSTENIYKG